MNHKPYRSRSKAITIRDCIHGDIDFSDYEANIIDTPQMQRLRGIKQLGFAYLVYPSAVHTRFEHSLGTCFVTNILMDRITKNTKHIFSDDERKIARAFALIHDASHIPFGHTLEGEHNIFTKHDKGQLKKIINEPEMKKALGDYFEPICEIEDFISKENEKGEIEKLKLIKPYLCDLVAGTIGSDILDYLRRDNLFTGLKRNYDPRIFDYFEIQDDRLVINLTKRGLVRIDAVSDILELLRMRYTLVEKVYYHHTKLAFGAMLAKAVRIAKQEHIVNQDLLLEMGDWELLNFLSTNPEVPEKSKIIAKRINPRSVYRRAFIIQRKVFGKTEEQFNDFVDKYRKCEFEPQTLETEIAKRANIPFENVVVYCPSRKMQLKEANVKTVVDEKVADLIDQPDIRPEETNMYYDKFKQLWSFYVFAYADNTKIREIGKIVGKILDMENEYKPSRR